jgi:serine/threonine-protein kinase HipA
MGGGKWGRPVHGYPSTHILKVEDRRYPGMAEREAGCLELAKAIGLTNVNVQVQTIASVPCLIVSRFDRAFGPDGKVVRLHQEDACQALGRDPEADRGRGKYESSGGPGLADIAGILERYGARPQLELEHLVRVATFTVAIGNADAHGKNVGLLHTEPGVVSLAPLYDTVPTVLWPNLRTAGAMTINHRAELGMVTLGDIITEASRWHLGSVIATRAATEVVQALLRSVEVLSELPEDLTEAVADRCRRLLAT